MAMIEKDEELVELPPKRQSGFGVALIVAIEQLEVGHSLRVSRKLLTVRSYLTKHKRQMYRKDSRYKKRFSARMVEMDGVPQKGLTRVWRLA